MAPRERHRVKTIMEHLYGDSAVDFSKYKVIMVPNGPDDQDAEIVERYHAISNNSGDEAPF